MPGVGWISLSVRTEGDQQQQGGGTFKYSLHCWLAVRRLVVLLRLKGWS